MRKRGRGRPVSAGGGMVCAVAAGRSVEELARAVERAVAGGGCVEVRFDWLGSGGRIREMCAWIHGGIYERGGVELIGTCRRKEAGGEFEGGVREQVELLREAAEAGCAWLDVEIETWRKLSEEEREKLRRAAKVMVSYHDFRTGKRARANTSAKNLRAILGELRRSEGDAGKIAVATETLSDAFRVVNLAQREKNLVAVPMGEMGTPARILALRQGSALAYAPVEEVDRARANFAGGDEESLSRGSA